MTTPIAGLGSQSGLSCIDPTLLGGSFTSSPSVEVAAACQKLLLQSLSQVNDMQLQSNAAVEELISGGSITQVETLSAVKKADLALKMMLQIRNQLLDAYNELQQVRI